MGSSVLASATTESGPAVSLFVIAACAVLAPLLARTSRGLVPATVVLIVLGVIVGPEVLGWAHADGLSMLRDLGMGFLFLLAGYEVDTTALRGRQGRSSASLRPPLSLWRCCPAVSGRRRPSDSP